MLRDIEERIAYGRSVRERADRLIEAHGAERGAAAARSAAEAPGVPEVERRFWLAVAARIVRLSGQPVWRPLFGPPEQSI